jgi:hypothetical protein
MQPDQLDTLYAALADAVDRAGDQHALLLATLALDLLAHHPDPATALQAILRAERLARV